MARKVPPPPPANGFSTLAQALAERGLAPTAPATPAPTPPPAPAEATSTPQGRAWLRLERAGRGGRTVTLLGGLQFGPAGAEAFLKRLKGALGVGASLDDEGQVVVQGDQRERLQAWLKHEGILLRQGS